VKNIDIFESEIRSIDFNSDKDIVFKNKIEIPLHMETHVPQCDIACVLMREVVKRVTRVMVEKDLDETLRLAGRHVIFDFHFVNEG
jgi:hypothetical protein